MKLSLDTPLDMHLHLREGAMLRHVAPLSARSFAGAIVMPNTVKPVDSAERLAAYRQEILAAVEEEAFTPYMTLFFRDYGEDFLERVKEEVIGLKLYPAGITTNSEGGVKSLEQAEETFEIMERIGIPLLVHGETGGFVMDREAEFLQVYDRIARKFPKLTIVMEHITTASAVQFLDRHENVHATVTLHHLAITLDDVAGGLLAPHLFCKPIAKRPEDREALLAAALSAHPKLMFGSDSAPHPRHKKECCGCAAGVFTAPIALPLLAEIFDGHGALEKLQAFVSDNAKRIYAINPPAKEVTLVKRENRIPACYGSIVPFRAGEIAAWDLEERS